MPKIQSRVPSQVARPPSKPAASAPKPAAPAAQAKAGWGTKAASVAGPAAASQARYPEVATTAKGLVDAHARAAKAMNQRDMVETSVGVNDAMDAVLKRTATELAGQLTERGQGAKADKVLKDLDGFFKKTGPAQHYRMDPERGTMGSLEDNSDRMTKLTAKLDKLAAELGKVNKEPVGDNQRAYNRHGGGEAVRQEALFALTFQKAADGGSSEKAISQAQAFFKALPKKIDSQIEFRGGSMEPLERAGSTAAALEAMSKKLSALN